MVYDFQAGGFSPLINPVAINKSTKQQESPYGDTHSLLQGAPYAEKKNGTVKGPPVERWRNSLGFAFLARSE